MNRKKILNHIIDILTAERDGIEIEYLPIGCTTWMQVSAVDAENLIKHHDRYRIKPPEPKLRPWKPEEVPVGALLKNRPDCGSEKWRWLILASASSGIVTAAGESIVVHAPDFIMKNAEHSTDGGKNWKPCGVEE